MSSNFDKVLNEAAAVRRNVEEARAAEEREHKKQMELARSIAEPYLRELGPHVVNRL